ASRWWRRNNTCILKAPWHGPKGTRGAVALHEIIVASLTGREEKGSIHVGTYRYSDHLPCHYPGALSDQHAAARRPRQADRPRRRHHHRHHLALEISRGVLDQNSSLRAKRSNP